MWFFVLLPIVRAYQCLKSNIALLNNLSNLLICFMKSFYWMKRFLLDETFSIGFFFNWMKLFCWMKLFHWMKLFYWLKRFRLDETISIGWITSIAFLNHLSDSLITGLANSFSICSFLFITLCHQTNYIKGTLLLNIGKVSFVSVKKFWFGAKIFFYCRTIPFRGSSWWILHVIDNVCLKVMLDCLLLIKETGI